MVWICAEGGSGYTGQTMLKMELPGTRKRGRPQRRLMDGEKEEMQRTGVTEEHAIDRVR